MTAAVASPDQSQWPPRMRSACRTLHPEAAATCAAVFSGQRMRFAISESTSPTDVSVGRPSCRSKETDLSTALRNVPDMERPLHTLLKNYLIWCTLPSGNLRMRATEDLTCDGNSTCLMCDHSKTKNGNGAHGQRDIVGRCEAASRAHLLELTSGQTGQNLKGNIGSTELGCERYNSSPVGRRDTPGAPS